MFPLFVAHVVFWVVLAVDAADAGVRRRTAVFGVLWAAGYVGSRFVPSGGSLFASYVAVLDIALILLVFKGEVR